MIDILEFYEFFKTRKILWNTYFMDKHLKEKTFLFLIFCNFFELNFLFLMATIVKQDDK